MTPARWAAAAVVAAALLMPLSCATLCPAGGDCRTTCQAPLGYDVLQQAGVVPLGLAAVGLIQWAWRRDRP